MVPLARFQPADLTNPPHLDRTFDLAVCLEVGEHLPKKSSPRLVDLLTTSAPAVLFSAAIPRQGGTNHINDQWPTYWEKLFAARGFRRLDPIRPQLWRSTNIEWWYRQNIYLYLRESVLVNCPELREEYELAKACPLELIHEYVVGRLAWTSTLRGTLCNLPRPDAGPLARTRDPAGLNWELLVVNNGSTDNTEAFSTRHAAALPLRRPRVQLCVPRLYASGSGSTPCSCAAAFCRHRFVASALEWRLPIGRRNA
jgi:hypothetical protein